MFILYQLHLVTPGHSCLAKCLSCIHTFFDITNIVYIVEQPGDGQVIGNIIFLSNFMVQSTIQ